MVKVTGGLFSIGAHGTLGGAITYKQRGGAQNVEKKPVPRNTRSVKQVEQRTSFQEAANHWHQLTSEQKQGYEQQGADKGITGYNFWVKQWLMGNVEWPIAEEVKFAVYTDIHYADKPPQGPEPWVKYMRDADDKLQAAVTSTNAWGPDFAIQIGDFIDGDYAGSPGDPVAELELIDAVYDNLNCPRHYVIGNHSLFGITKEEYFAHCGATQRWYSFDVNGRHFIVLDAQWLEDYTERGGPGGYWWGYIPAQELEWLEEDLAQTELQTIVFCHHMLAEEGDLGVHNAGVVRAVLEGSGKVKAVFCGHKHFNEKVVINGIPYLVFFAMVYQPYPACHWAKVVWEKAGGIYVYGEGEQADYLPI